VLDLLEKETTMLVTTVVKVCLAESLVALNVNRVHIRGSGSSAIVHQPY
jgi:hypothetical protein